MGTTRVKMLKRQRFRPWIERDRRINEVNRIINSKKCVEKGKTKAKLLDDQQ